MRRLDEVFVCIPEGQHNCGSPAADESVKTTAARRYRWQESHNKKLGHKSRNGRVHLTGICAAA